MAPPLLLRHMVNAALLRAGTTRSLPAEVAAQVYGDGEDKSALHAATSSQEGDDAGSSPSSSSSPGSGDAESAVASSDSQQHGAHGAQYVEVLAQLPLPDPPREVDLGENTHLKAMTQLHEVRLRVDLDYAAAHVRFWRARSLVDEDRVGRAVELRMAAQAVRDVGSLPREVALALDGDAARRMDAAQDEMTEAMQALGVRKGGGVLVDVDVLCVC